MNLKEKFKRNKGITLIAIVITIIVLLILAGISISMLTGQNSILKRATEAKEKTETANIEEQRKLAQAEALTNIEEITYKGIRIPEGFAPTRIEGEDSVDEGLVITDKYGNEYVWIEVPKTTTVYPTAGISIAESADGEFTEAEYTKIAKDLENYVGVYPPLSGSNNAGHGINDVYYPDSTEGWFEDENAYNTAKKKMLKSVYQNGGFWVGRYEAGIEDEANIRKLASDTVTLTPVTKQNMYPYNFVTRTQAKVLAEQVESGNYTSSLMFGVQWDLMLKFIEEKTVAKANEADKETVRAQFVKDMRGNGGLTYGNFRDNLWNITNANAKYSIDYGSSFTACPKQKTENANILLTTGADKSFSLMNIYDVGGNEWEWTLEKHTIDDNKPCMIRGGRIRFIMWGLLLCGW